MPKYSMRVVKRSIEIQQSHKKTKKCFVFRMYWTAIGNNEAFMEKKTNQENMHGYSDNSKHP